MRAILAVLMALCLVTVGMGSAVAAPGVQSAGGPAASTGANASTADGSTTLTILQYNDVQTAASQDGTFPRMAELIEQRRAAHDNPVMVVGAGDEVSPHSLSPLSQWETPVDALNEIEPDAEVIGNHDLDYGFDAVENFSSESEFPWLAANVVKEDTGETIPGTEPYTVVEKGGVTVGVIGVVDEKIKGKTEVDFDEQGYEVRDYKETTQKYAKQLKNEENVDVVLVLAHLGVPNAKKIAKSTDNVDAIAVGDDEIEFPPQEVSGTVVMEAEARAEHLNEVNLTIEDGEVTAWNGMMHDVTEDTPKNDAVSSVITAAREDQLSTELGTSTVDLDSRFSSNYGDETALGNMITDAFRWKEGSEIAITNAGGIRSNTVYEAGPVTAGDVYSMLPFGNTLVTVELTGAEVKQLLASQVTTTEEARFGAQPQLQVSGVSYEYVPHHAVPMDERIQDVHVNGEPLDEDETYTVTVNSYMAGWDGSVLSDAEVVSETQALYGQVTASYIESKGTVSPKDWDRIRRVDANVNAAPVLTNGEGTATAIVAMPNDAQSVNESQFYVVNETGATLQAQSVTVKNGAIFVKFDDAKLQALAGDDGSLNLYGAYTDDDDDQRNNWEFSRLNADITVVERGDADGRVTARTTQPTVAVAA
jgi:5'-nucleotidase/UDP-sugar diphosphatase